ncbi:helix-turn-helix domain-containing protein [Nocardiopsis valliformis]|uniref:helix-turn-helix domain-containing protein n=1 Tax=Nocardiopsis valliformis TaxID=239974 RepID=UPI00034A2115|nr:helix-turn-helix domain-containing protein [Nocardiopsis valliformis]
MDPGQANYNPGYQADSLEELLRKLPDASTPAASPTPRARRKTAKHIRGEEAEKLVAAYRDGATIYDLAERFGVTRQTVSNILKRHGVQTRWNRLTDEQVDEAARLHEQGWPLAEIARKLGTHSTTVRNHLLC